MRASQGGRTARHGEGESDADGDGRGSRLAGGRRGYNPTRAHAARDGGEDVGSFDVLEEWRDHMRTRRGY